MTIGQPSVPATGRQGNNSDHINLKVVSEDNIGIMFKIKKRTCLGKLMNAYCDRIGVTLDEVSFQRDGEILDQNDTPSSRDMNEDDVIEVFKIRP